MRKIGVVAGLSALCLWTSLLSAQETAESKIESVSLFKNGLVVVKHEVSVDQPGEYILEDLSTEPVHGTFWIESEGPVTAKATFQEIQSEQIDMSQLNLQEGFAGQSVEIHFKEPGQATLTGVIEQVKPVKNWDRNYNPSPYGYYGYYGNSNSGQVPYYGGLNLIVRTEEGLVFVDPSSIAYLTLQGQPHAKTRKPVVILNIPKTFKSKSPVTISYLAKGLSWAPSYRVDLVDEQTLRIEQTAVIKNEMVDLNQAEMRLITGFPQIKFGLVTSPLSLQTNLSNFFAQLNQSATPGASVTSNMMAQQAVAMSGYGGEGVDVSMLPQAEGVDLYYQSIGQQTLKEGDALFVSLANAIAPYERVVEWIVPDTRTADGRYVQDYQRQQEPGKYEDAAWDAVKFKNPFAFPMTTAPASIYTNGKFSGQSESKWVNAGEENTVYITKALSLRTHVVEHEEEGERPSIKIGGSSYYRATVSGELIVCNHRSKDVDMLIRRRFSGELITATDSPKTVLLEEGVYSINKRNELNWTIALKPGEEKKLNYQYTVLVPY